MREDSLLKRGRLRQRVGEGNKRCRKFERCSGLEDGASQNWWEGRQIFRGDRQLPSLVSGVLRQGGVTGIILIGRSDLLGFH